MARDRRPLLLDSHSFIWAMTEPERLPDRARAAVTDADRVVMLSTASIWEIATKVARGRWPEAEPTMARLEATLRRAAIVALPVSLAHAQAAGVLDWQHRDPFDRMLVAQAIVEDAILITVDRAVAGAAAHLALHVLWA